MKQNSNKLLTLSEIAERFCVGVSRVQGWIKRGELRAINVSQRANSTKPQFRVTQQAVDDFEQARTVFLHKQSPRPRRRTSTYEHIID